MYPTLSLLNYHSEGRGCAERFLLTWKNILCHWALVLCKVYENGLVHIPDGKLVAPKTCAYVWPLIFFALVSCSTWVEKAGSAKEIFHWLQPSWIILNPQGCMGLQALRQLRLYGNQPLRYRRRDRWKMIAPPFTKAIGMSAVPKIGTPLFTSMPR